MRLRQTDQCRGDGRMRCRFNRATKSARRLILIFLAAAWPVFAQQRENAEPTNGKRVVIDKTEQVLRAYEWDRLVIESRVSTGKQGKRTPNGIFHAGEKLRMHRSRLYHNAPMPFSVQISGNYFIHGFSSVPRRPASHGCIRLPLENGNPAKQFFDWVEPGTPIEITGEWKAN
jgi:lipoprotein-anchoring transpeptidase ErfK/SrfK